MTAAPTDRLRPPRRRAVGDVGGAHVARVLEEDPELGDGLDADAFAQAAELARAAVMTLKPGAWQPDSWPASVRSGFGLLALDGMLLRRVRLGERGGVELLAAGDLLRPWQREDALASIPRQLGWQVLTATRLAVLDIEFAQRISPFPQIAAHLTGRALRRSRNFAVNMAIVQQPRVDARVHMLLWHLADRFGTVGPGGVTLTLKLTQTVIAALVAARRPTVSAALGALERSGHLTRLAGGWLLTGAPPGEVGTTGRAAEGAPVATAR